MLMKRGLWIAALLLVGFAVTTISVWALAFSAASSDQAAFSPSWILGRLPILIGILLLVAGFRMLGSTRVRQPSPDADDPAP